MSEDDDIPVAFREQFRRHNREAVILTIVTLLAAILLWAVFYYVIYGIVLLFLSAAKGSEAAGIPPSYFPLFGGCALALCVLALVLRKIRPGYYPVDHKSIFENFMDVVLMLPRVTFEVWGNFTAFQRPSERELQAAWDLFRTMGGSRGKIAIQQIPVEIPNSRLRDRVMLLLQLAGLAEVRRYHSGVWLVLTGDQARRLARSSVRIDPQLPDEAFHESR